MSEQKKMLIICFSPLSRDPRVHRQIMFLKNHYHITAVGFDAPKVKDVEFIPVFQTSGKEVTEEKPSSIRTLMAWSPVEKLSCAFRNYFLAPLRKYFPPFSSFEEALFERYYWSQNFVQSVLTTMQGKTFDLIIANDINTLPLALRMANGKSKVLFDAHEYHPREQEDLEWWRLFFQQYSYYLCSRYIPQADKMMTACERYAEEYRKNFGFSPKVFSNAPFYEDLAPTPVAKDQIRIIHHGGAIPSRQIENMIYLMDLLDERFTLDMVLVSTDQDYLQQLHELGENRPRVTFRKPFPMDQISRSSNQYDIGLHILPSYNLMYQLTVPNKLLEYIQSRLAIAIWPSPGMADVVREHQCGIIADDFTIEAMAAKLNKLSTDEIQNYKKQSHKAAKILSAETNREVLLEIVEDLLNV